MAFLLSNMMLPNSLMFVIRYEFVTLAGKY